jgi:hypothetical protein
VLRQTGDELVQIGQVGGLGKGEQIYGVRFIGDVGYVVTFRQTDPLYTIDLKDPAAPKNVGELKIPGYSAYLHPIDATTILGVGVDGTEEGQMLGLQLSLFDVSDLAAPKRIHTAQVGDGEFGWSEALFDPKAFLFWQKTGLALLPVEWYAYDEQTMTETGFHGALGYTIDAEAGIVQLGSIEHPIDRERGVLLLVRHPPLDGDRRPGHDAVRGGPQGLAARRPQRRELRRVLADRDDRRRNVRTCPQG